MSKYTPGPWRVGTKTAYGVRNPNLIQAEINAVAMVYGIPQNCKLDEIPTDQPEYQNGLANARLIAAAPTMLEALKEIAAWEFDIMGDCVADAKNLAKAAIRLAEGELTAERR